MLLVASLVSMPVFAQEVTGSGTQNTNSNSTGTGTAAVNYAPVNHNYAPDMKPNTVIAPSINPTVSCAGVTSGGLAFAGVQIAGGGSRVDKECQNMELAKMVYVMGDRDGALEIACNEFPAYRAARLRQSKADPRVQACLADLPDDYKLVIPVIVPQPLQQVIQQVQAPIAQPNKTEISLTLIMDTQLGKSAPTKKKPTTRKTTKCQVVAPINVCQAAK